MLRKRDWTLIALVLVSWGLLGFCAYRVLITNRFERPYGRLLGDHWIRMTPAEKRYFVEGYKRGSSSGHSDACLLFNDLAKQQLLPVSHPSGIVLDPCQGRARSWSKGTEGLVRQMDNFYSRFPGDRGLHIESLIQNLSDQSGLTIEQIHARGTR